MSIYTRKEKEIPFNVVEVDNTMMIPVVFEAIFDVLSHNVFKKK